MSLGNTKAVGALNDGISNWRRVPRCDKCNGRLRRASIAMRQDTVFTGFGFCIVCKTFQPMAAYHRTNRKRQVKAMDSRPFDDSFQVKAAVGRQLVVEGQVNGADAIVPLRSLAGITFKAPPPAKRRSKRTN